MPRRRLPARLRLRKARADRQRLWVILDGEKEIGTGFGENDLAAAEAALDAYRAQQYNPPIGERQPGRLLVDEVMGVYLRDHVQKSPSRDWIINTAEPILEWWAGKPLTAVNGGNCRTYVAWRTAQRVKSFKKRQGPFVSDQTARHELKTLRAAIRFYNKEHGPLTALPEITLPKKAPPRSDYWWTRGDAAKRLRAARARSETYHLARLILIGLYSGTRPGAIVRLRWLPSHRRGEGASESKKRQPPARLHRKLVLHAQRWRKADLSRGIASVIHYQGVPIRTKVRRSWETVRKLAGYQRKDSPHVLRHTAATWLMQSGVDLAEISGYLGMSVEVLEQVYMHHHPDFQRGAAQATPGKRMNRGKTR